MHSIFSDDSQQKSDDEYDDRGVFEDMVDSRTAIVSKSKTKVLNESSKDIPNNLPKKLKINKEMEILIDDEASK